MAARDLVMKILLVSLQTQREAAVCSDHEGG